jgi:hypothetical protein
MVCIEDLPQKYKLHVMDSDRYSIRGAQVHDDVSGQFVAVGDIVENMTER